MTGSSKILVAGFGNVLHGDDGFGIALLRRLQQDAAAGAASRAAPWSAEVHTLEVGIGGISLVQELMRGFDALVVLDAHEAEAAPGRVVTLALHVDDLRDHAVDATRDAFADIHYAEPGRALALARALGVLPERVYLVGCVPSSCELGEPLSPAAEAALGEAETRLHALLRQLADEQDVPAALRVDHP